MFPVTETETVVRGASSEIKDNTEDLTELSVDKVVVTDKKNTHDQSGDGDDFYGRKDEFSLSINTSSKPDDMVTSVTSMIGKRVGRLYMLMITTTIRHTVIQTASLIFLCSQ